VGKNRVEIILNHTDYHLIIKIDLTFNVVQILIRNQKHNVRQDLAHADVGLFRWGYGFGDLIPYLLVDVFGCRGVGVRCFL
jgi:hypothetical protein